MVARAGAQPSDETQRALSELIRAYWYPLYAFARRRGQNDHDAMDLTQGFFTHLLSGKALVTVSPEKGRFRSFLLASFKNFMANQRRAADTIRRGGEATILPLMPGDLSNRYELEVVDEETPERVFERSWVEALLQRVRLQLGEDYRAAGKGELYEMLEPHLTHRGHALPRAEIGRRLNLSSAALAMSIHRMRRRYGELLRQEVAATVADPADIEDELRCLISVLSDTR
jgi:RNA polymerase sigma factor (sigma-70 family)